MNQVRNYQTYQHIKQMNPKLYAIEIADEMGITEAELAQIRVGFESQQLGIDAKSLLNFVSEWGTVKAITRNPYVVSEQFGQYENRDFTGHAGLVLNPRALDLRIFFGQWKHIFAFSEHYTKPDGSPNVRHSIQIFNDQGMAIHKFYLTDDSQIDLFVALVNQYKLGQIAPLNIIPTKPIKITGPTTDFSAIEFESKWRALQDVHDFFRLLKSYHLTRQQAFRQVSKDLAYQVAANEIEPFLRQIQQTQNEVMIFVSNPGCVQIFTGRLEKIVVLRGWLNIFNEKFTLHLQYHEIDEAWITRKPTKDGIVTSLELYAKDGTQILQMYGERTEGNPEQDIWRKQLQTLSQQFEAMER